MKTSLKISFSLFNLLLVASMGVIMRYKIGFEFPYFNQKNLQEAHSHFAFFGWLTHTLMVVMLSLIEKKSSSINLKKFNWIIYANLLCAYCMLVSFLLFGYNFSSILFSTIAIFISFWFTFAFYKEIRNIQHSSISIKWFISAMAFNLIASLGTFALAYFMANKIVDQHNYLASIYFYLHFQYNGWFLFAIFGLAHTFIENNSDKFIEKPIVFWIFTITCIPTYFLSILWIDLPTWLYAITCICTIFQFIAWLIFLNSLRPQLKNIKERINPYLYNLGLLIIVAISIKFALQLGSTVPSISKLAFGFRPIVIAYLHLILLAVLSLFLIVYLINSKFVPNNRRTLLGITIFASGIYLTEIALAVQGIASFNYVLVPFINEILLSLAILMFSGIFILYINKIKSK